MPEYATDFQTTEPILSEGGVWINGGVVGKNWGNVQTSGSNAFCDVFTTGQNDSVAFIDPAKFLFPPDQRVYGVLKRRPSYQPPDGQETELFLRADGHDSFWRGYEVTYEFPFNGQGQVFIVLWSGDLNAATVLNGVSIGDVPDGTPIMATAVGNTITAYVGSQQVLSVTDSTWPSGQPGMGYLTRSGGILDGWCLGSWGARAAGVQNSVSSLSIANGQTTSTPIAVGQSFSRSRLALNFASSFPTTTSLTVLKQVSTDGGSTWRDYGKVVIPTGVGLRNKLGTTNTLELHSATSDLLPANTQARVIYTANAPITLNGGNWECNA